jgi:beta-glucosidase-like glycosyl hydrolase
LEADKTYAQFVWRKSGEDGGVVMTDILGMVMSKQPRVRVSDDGQSAQFMNADGDVVMTATNTNQEATDVAGEQENDESLG